ncbi:MAG: flavodoxin domain-containing protein [Planctomycetota bacterium]
MRALIVFSTHEGHTEKIADHMATRLRLKGIPADRYNTSDPDAEAVDMGKYDAIIVGSSMHYSHYDQNLAEYLRRYQGTLRQIPSAFYSVSLGILSDNKSEQDEIRKITSAYLEETGWDPTMRRHFAGALNYSKYGWFKRHMMQWVVSRAGSKTNPKYDYEFTDWHKVDEFVDQFVDYLLGTTEPAGDKATFTALHK